MENVSDYFGALVFDNRKMQEMLSEEVYTTLKKTIDRGELLDSSIADAVASAMKDWALSMGATHFTHWFQPLTGITAEKHESFIMPAGGGRVLMEFSRKELIRGESDASSFPSGGLRETFEARGYTAWDPTSYAFIKDKTLCIPTVFISYGGEALDKKTPLLRSMETLNRQCLRILKLFGNDEVKSVRPSVGPEQEYFLIDREIYDRRKDLIFTGRTLYGAQAPKGQEMDDHYYGVIKPRVQEFMTELNRELWKVGVLAKTEHNEAAPSQHELAPVYTTANIAVDHNQLTMEIMQKVAARHGLVCLLHEKPFAGVNGSGKHNNWSLTTDAGVNLLRPGRSPYENAQFLLFLVAVIRAVDDYADLLRISVASPGNDHRLGANEAPPAVVSVFLGDELTGILEAIENDTPYKSVKKKTMRLGVDALPTFSIDTTDRNRTAPFAFTGNKFEFRMLGSASSVSDCNVMLNTAVAESLRVYADVLEQAEDFNEALHDLIRDEFRAHKRIVFNGNAYDGAWIREATMVRRLPNYPTTPDCLPHLLDEKNVHLLTSHKVFTEVELRSRLDIRLNNYCKALSIEANTMIDMAVKEILPAITAYADSIADLAMKKQRVDEELPVSYEKKLLRRLSGLSDEISERAALLSEEMQYLKKLDDARVKAEQIRDEVLPKMEALREAADEAESITAEEYWPFPSYSELLFGVR
ncbi:MAG: glutamine synthetase III [Lachnospiraceae bacterium]|nr:glutamine synthetase III [Lachnospiraceae bacterium]